MDTVSLVVRADVFARLKNELRVEVGEDLNALFIRLLEPAEKAGKNGVVTGLPKAAAPTEWRSSRGERFPIGLKLTGSYKNKGVEAIVTVNGIEFQGKTYDNPSTAAAAAKIWAGCAEAAAPENGWNFWMMPAGVGNRVTSINRLRRKA